MIDHHCKPSLRSDNACGLREERTVVGEVLNHENGICTVVGVILDRDSWKLGNDAQGLRFSSKGFTQFDTMNESAISSDCSNDPPFTAAEIEIDGSCDRIENLQQQRCHDGLVGRIVPNLAKPPIREVGPGHEARLGAGDAPELIGAHQVRCLDG